MKTKAFTLIELLIVIAIIAILALIALPNFLEAQVRAKVARAQSDLRSVGLAIEAYVTDYSRPPLDDSEYTALGITANDPMELRPLTTPVAYIPRVIPDVFVERGTTTAYVAWKPYRYGSYVIDPSVGPTAREIACRKRGYIWFLRSLGPSRNGTSGLGVAADPSATLSGLPMDSGKIWVYDPSNGTVSFGFIMRTNKGEVGPQDIPH